jgi:hypothetical protein
LKLPFFMSEHSIEAQDPVDMKQQSEELKRLVGF